MLSFIKKCREDFFLPDDIPRIILMIYEFTHVMLKVCVKLAVLLAERPDPLARPVCKPTDLVRLKTMLFACICSTIELPVHI